MSFNSVVALSSEQLEIAVQVGTGIKTFMPDRRREYLAIKGTLAAREPSRI
jgi:hypothetical protein